MLEKIIALAKAENLIRSVEEFDDGDIVFLDCNGLEIRCEKTYDEDEFVAKICTGGDNYDSNVIKPSDLIDVLRKFGRR